MLLSARILPDGSAYYGERDRMEVFSGFLTNPALAIAGLVLGAVPVIIHLLNRTFYDRQRWAAMDFLLRAEQKTRRRVRLENFLLMLLRYLLLALLGLALAQPFLNQPALSVIGESETHYVIVLDQSYSMHASDAQGTGSSVYQSAKKEVRQFINNNVQVSGGDTISLISASAHSEHLIKTPSQDQSRALRMVEKSSPSFYQGDLNESLNLVRDHLEQVEEKKNTHLIWVTDLQENTWIPKEEGARDRVKDKIDQLGSRVDEFVITDVGNERGNVGIMNLTPRDEFLVQDRPIDLSVRVRNFSDRESSATLTLYKDKQKVETMDVNLEPGNSVEKQFNPIRFEEVGSHTVHAELSQDPLVTDNTRYRSLHIDEHIDVLLVDGEPEGESNTRGESFFLKSALDPEEASSPYNVNVVNDYRFEDEELGDYDLVMLANLSSISQEKRDELRTFLKRGGGVLMFFGDKVTIKAYNDSLYYIDQPLLPGELEEVERRSPEEKNVVHMEKLNLDHPALSFFRPYEDKLTSLITHGWVRMKIPDDALNVRVLARFNDQHQAPAITERSIGRGKFLTIQTTADMEWNFWPNFQGYLMLVDRLSRYLLKQKEQAVNVQVGNQLNIPVSAFESSSMFRVVNPDQRVTTMSPLPVREGEYVIRLDDMRRPGFFRIEKKQQTDTAGWVVHRIVSSNVVSEEGNLKRISRQKMKSTYPGVTFRSTQPDTEMGGGSGETDLWKLFAGLVLIFLLVESLLALRIDRKRQV